MHLDAGAELRREQQVSRLFREKTISPFAAWVLSLFSTRMHFLGNHAYPDRHREHHCMTYLRLHSWNKNK
jgi:hypothetical protein